VARRDKGRKFLEGGQVSLHIRVKEVRTLEEKREQSGTNWRAVYTSDRQIQIREGTEVGEN